MMDIIIIIEKSVNGLSFKLKVDAAIKVHYQAGRCMMAEAINFFNQEPPCFLSQKKCCYQKNIGMPGKSNSGDNPYCDDERYRNMNGQKPLKGECFDIRSPVSERNDDQKNKSTG